MAHEFLTDCVFLGHEAEGPDRGQFTLFVASHYLNPMKIWKYLEGDPRIKRVYFGAGSKYGLPSDYFELAETLIRKGYKVVVEVNRMGQIHIIPDKLRDRVEMQIVMTFTMDGMPIPKNFCKAAQYVSVFKFVDEIRILWCEVKPRNKTMTFLDDPFFAKDRKVRI